MRAGYNILLNNKDNHLRNPHERTKAKSSREPSNYIRTSTVAT